MIAPEHWLQIRMQARVDGDVTLRHFLGYHSEAVMGFGLKDCEGLSFFTNRDFGDPRGDVLWFVGRGRRPGISAY